MKDSAASTAAVRTPDQTGYAVWWMEFAEGSVNRLARQLVSRRHTHLWRAARLFALLNMGLFDRYVADWDSKYEHDHWRPYTAMREADRDGNPATEPDPSVGAAADDPAVPGIRLRPRGSVRQLFPGPQAGLSATGCLFAW